MRLTNAILAVLGAVVLAGCERPPQEYSRTSPEAVVDSAILMVQRSEADRLTELVYARNIQMRGLLNQIGRTLGAMEKLADAIKEKFPEELAAMRARIEADGGASIVEALASGGVNLRGGGDQFREIAMRIFADPYGFLEDNGDKLDVIYLADDRYGVMYDGEVLLKPWGVLIEKQEDGWYLMLPTNLPGARKILPDTEDEYMLWGSMFKTVENGVIDMTDDVRRGRTTSMNQLGQSALEKFAIPAVMVAYAYARYAEEDRREERAAEQAAERAEETPEPVDAEGGG